MAVHTYIGARYVPRFMGTYDPSQIYEALDVVDNGSGTSYIARKVVPAGTPLTDTDYWFVYGASSGAIIQLQNDMIAAQNDIGALQGDVTTIQGDINDLADDIEYLAEDTRRIVTLADSYGAQPTLSDAWPAKLEAIIGGDFYSFYAGGIGIYKQSGGLNAQSLLSTNSANIPDHDTITDIVIAMGGNDVNETLTNVGNAYDSLIAYIRTEYPKARIHFAFPGFNNQWTLTEISKCMSLIQLMQDKCGEHMAHYCSGIEYIMHNLANVQGDGVHPTAAGALAIAYGISVCLEKGSYHYKASLLTTMHLNNPIVGDVGCDVLMTIDDNVATIDLFGGSSISETSRTFPNDTPVVIGTFNDALFRNGHIGGMGMMYSNGASNPSFMMFTSNGTNFYAYRTGASITLPDFSVRQLSFTVPTMYV